MAATTSTLSNEELQQLVKQKVALIKGELAGFTQWQANHILECVKEELAEQTAGVLDNLIVLS